MLILWVYELELTCPYQHACDRLRGYFGKGFPEAYTLARQERHVGKWVAFFAGGGEVEGAERIEAFGAEGVGVLPLVGVVVKAPDMDQ